MSKNKLTDIEKKIITSLLNVEKELRYSEIRDICDLTDPTCAKYLKQLSNLSNNGILKKRRSKMKREYPHPVFYRIKNDIDTFKKLIAEFIGTMETQDDIAFFTSVYCQKMINHELVEKIKTEWNYTKNSEMERGYYIGISRNSKGEKVGEEKMEYNKEKYLSDEKVCEMLRLSPSALWTLLFTKQTKTDGFGRRHKLDKKLESSNFNEILILNLLLDFRKYGNLRNGIDIDFDTQMKFTLQLRNGTETINLLGKPQDPFIRFHNGILRDSSGIENIRKLREELKEKNTVWFSIENHIKL